MSATRKIARPWLAPLTLLYAAGTGLRSAGLRLGLERVERLQRPVVSVGSLSAGGAGKTPFVIAIAKLLTEQGLGVDALTRGYGRLDSRPAQVDPQGSAEQFGDEPLLISREASVPVYVAARRVEAGRLAEASGARPAVHLLDDGFQHQQLARNVDIVLVSSHDLADWLLPAGNLREGLSALRRADVLAVEAGDDAAISRLARLGLTAHRPIWRYRRIMQVPSSEGPMVAFCGIARPQQFFAGLRASGLTLAASHAFPDHHRYIARDVALLERLLRESRAAGLVTTAKDQVRLGTSPFSSPLHTAALQVELEQPDAVAEWLGRNVVDPSL